MSSSAPASTSRGLRAFNVLLLVALVVMVGLCGVSLADFLLQPESYRFGTEVGGWVYRSRVHYVGSLLAELVVLAGGLVMSILARNPARVLVIRLLSLLIDGAFIAGAALVR
jgi:hypothetical protein